MLDLISFKSFLKPGKPTTADFVRFLGMLLQGLSTHVIEGDTEDLTVYRDETNSLAEHISESSTSEDILLTVTAGLRSLEEHNRRTHKFIRAQSIELKTALRTATETIAGLAHSKVESVHQLAVVEKKMEQASAIEDIRLLRVKLQDCLTIIREESARLRTESDTRLTSLEETIESVFSEGRFNPALLALDAVTGLENRVAAERLIRQRITEGKTCAAALFVVNKLSTVNRRFGRTTGDEVLLMVSQHLGQSMPPNTVLFRWSGPALAAVVDIQDNFEEVNRKLSRAANAQLEKNIEASGRSAFVPISFLLLVQKVGAGKSPKDVFKAMDQFVAANALEEPAPASE